MPSASSRVVLHGLSISRIQKFIPKKWKQSVKPVDIQSNPLSESSDYRGNELKTIITDDASMLENLVISLKEFVTRGHILKAFKSYSLIQLHVSSTAYDVILHPVSSLLVSCTNLKLLLPGKQLHAQIISLGLEQHPLLVPKVITFYTKFNLLDDARVVTENCKILHPLPWTLLISSFVKNEHFKEALSAYTKMLNRGIIPDNFTYPSVLKACGEELDVNFGRMVHSSITASCHDWNLYVHNALISMYGKFGKVDVARDLFNKMLERDDVSWNTMIGCYASKGMWQEAFELFDCMHAEGIEPNFITWNTIAGGCLRARNFKRSLELLSQMKSNGFHLDPVSMIIGLGACSHIGALKLGKEIHGSAIRSCCDEFENVRNAMITMYSRCKDLEHAYILFQSIKERSIITWNSMLSGYTYMDKSEEASFLFQEMLLSGVEPNYVTIASILPLCARVANLQHGKEFHCYITRRKVFEDCLLLWNALVSMYARSGKLVAAKRVFDLMQKRDEVTYTSLIAGYGMQGEGHIAIKLFEEMISLQIKPDHLTMVAVLSACSHSGLVIEGQFWFEKMQSFYGLVPRLEHFSCMVDLYGRAGLLNKAKEIITRMPYKRVVSCSDIVALAARDSVYLSGGPDYGIPLGRRDGLTFATVNATLQNLPPPFANATTILSMLATKNFDPTDVVALSGGHTVGISHCTSFTTRLYPTQDPTMDKTFANNLKVICPTVNSTNTTVMDIRSPNKFDNKYYVDLMNRQGLFTSDQDLYTDSRTRGIVTSFAINETLFFEKFVVSMIKMGQLSVLTGNNGEIRANCSVRNADNKSYFASVVEELPVEEAWSDL